MTIALNTRARGLVGARAEGNAGAILAEMQSAFETFKAERTKELADLRAGMADVVQTEKVDRINAEITALQKQLSETNQAIAGLRLGVGPDSADPAVVEHAAAFDKFFRKGVEAGLHDLEVKAALTTQSDPDGGYLVPDEVATTIDRVLGKQSVVRQLASAITISTGTYKKIVNQGGATSGWVGEEDGRPATATPTLREIAINTKELYANPATTQTALDDAVIDIESWLADEVAIEFAEQEGDAFVNGDGVKQPRGLLAYPMVADGSYAWGKVGYVKTGAAADFVTPTSSVSPADVLIDLVFTLKSGYRGDASFLMSDLTMAKVRKFKDADGAFIWAPPTAQAPVPTILGKPVYNDDNMPAVGAGAYPILFGDFRRAYLIVDRAGIRVLRDPFTNKPYVSFYTTKRVGGGIVNFEAMKALKIAA